MTAPLESVPVRVGEAPTAASHFFSWKPKLAHNNENESGLMDGSCLQNAIMGRGRAVIVSSARGGWAGR